MAGPSTKTELLKTHAYELVKQHLEYDELFRIVRVFETSADSEHGDACLVTQYAYDGTSTRMTGRKESYGTWNSAWDI